MGSTRKWFAEMMVRVSSLMKVWVFVPFIRASRYRHPAVLASMLLVITRLDTWQCEPKGGPMSRLVSAFLPKNASKGDMPSDLVKYDANSSNFFAELITRLGIKVSDRRYGRLNMVARMISLRVLIIRSMI